MATAVRTRRIRDEEQARFPAGHAFDGGGLQQFTRNLRAHTTILAFHCRPTSTCVGNLLRFRSNHVYANVYIVTCALEYGQIWSARSTTSCAADR